MQRRGSTISSSNWVTVSLLGVLPTSWHLLPDRQSLFFPYDQVLPADSYADAQNEDC